jgi:hypothetical protein
MSPSDRSAAAIRSGTSRIDAHFTVSPVRFLCATGTT